jgi:hypothetical protein
MYILLFLSLISQSECDLALSKYRAFQNEIHPLDDFEKLDEKIEKTNSLLENPILKEKKHEFIIFYLNKLKKDLEKIKKMPENDKNGFSIAYRNFITYMLFYVKEDSYPEGFVTLQRFETVLLKYFDKFSFVHFFTEHYKLTVTTELNKKIDFTEHINDRYNVFNESDWNGNPELSFYLALQCTNSENNKKYDDLLEYATKLLDVLDENFAEDEIKKIVPQGFLLMALVKTKKYERALTLYNKINKKHFKSIRKDTVKVLLRIHQASFDLFIEKNMKKEALASQELKLEAMRFFRKNDNKELKDEAILMYRMYIDSGDMEKANKIKTDFKL